MQTKETARVLHKRFEEATLTHANLRNKQGKEEAGIVTVTVSRRVILGLHFYRQKAGLCK